MEATIRKIGIEIEGGWDERPVTMVRDGSVHTDARYDGEIHSLRPAIRERTLFKILDNYPKYTNHTCGIHVHFSVKTEKDYQLAMSRSLTRYIVYRLKKWGIRENIVNNSFWQRTRGENQYCRNRYFGTEQSKMTSKNSNGSRYTIVNYCYLIHKTFEVRVLPAFRDESVARKAITELISIVSRYFELSKKKKMIRGEIEIIEGGAYEEKDWDIC